MRIGNAPQTGSTSEPMPMKSREFTPWRGGYGDPVASPALDSPHRAGPIGECGAEVAGGVGGGEGLGRFAVVVDGAFGGAATEPGGVTGGIERVET
jgi:hypothetical protein